MLYLVIGGTGMLQGTLLGLLDDGHDVVTISRRPDRFRSLYEKAGDQAGRLHWAAGDYSDPDSFRAALSTLHNGSVPDAVIAWMPDGPSWPVLFEAMRAHPRSSPWALFRVQGSRASREEMPPHPRGVELHLIILGFVMASGRARWLTHEEIAAGTLTAIRQPAARHIVGIVEPWEHRPAW